MPLPHLPTSTTFIASATSIGPPPLRVRHVHRRIPTSAASIASPHPLHPPRPVPECEAACLPGATAQYPYLPSSSIFSPPRHSGAVRCAYWGSYKPTGREKIQATYPLSG